MSDRPTFDWPPLDTAVRRASDRRNAMLEGLGRADEQFAVCTDEEAYSHLRAWFSGTDIDLPAFDQMGEMLMATAANGLHEGVGLSDVMSSLIRDAFTIGFWTREAMEP